MIEAGCEGEAGGPVRRARPVALRRQVLLHRWRAARRAPCSAITSALSSFPASLPGAGAGVVFDGYGGAINQVGASDTAFVHRSAVAVRPVLHHVSGRAAVSRARNRRPPPGSTTCSRPSRRRRQGSYQNYIDPTLTNWQQAYYGSNLPRLQQVKRNYDPDDVFRFRPVDPVVDLKSSAVMASVHSTG